MRFLDTDVKDVDMNGFLVARNNPEYVLNVNLHIGISHERIFPSISDVFKPYH